MSNSRSSTPTPAGRGKLSSPQSNAIELSSWSSMDTETTTPAGSATGTTTTFTGEFRLPLRTRIRLMRLSGPTIERPRTPIPSTSLCATPHTPPHQATLSSVDECPGAPRKANKHSFPARLRWRKKFFERPQSRITSANEIIKRAMGSTPAARRSPSHNSSSNNNSVGRGDVAGFHLSFFEILRLDDSSSRSHPASSDSASTSYKTPENSCRSSGSELLAPKPIWLPGLVDFEVLEKKAADQK
ncbi:hypothetical protein F4810DRAFT_715159 [Camillea tinctor]|nr:hypothetical protein F4810DRAFT_715159 [Camillea tinctor]